MNTEINIGAKFNLTYEDGTNFTATITKINLAVNNGNVWIYFDIDSTPIDSKVFADYIKKGIAKPE